jgi:hypothetical protein
VYCLNAVSGTSIWNFTTAGAVDSSPAITNGYVYVGGRNHVIYCLPTIFGTVPPPDNPPIGSPVGILICVLVIAIASVAVRARRKCVH